MSSEADGAVTGDGGQRQGLVPKLRFPEFRDAGDWARRKLGPHLKEHTGRVAASTEIPVYSSSRSGLRPQGEYFDGSNLQNFGEYSVVPEGYITFRHMSDDGTFKFNLNQTGEQIAVSKEYPVFTTSGISSPFLLNILNDSYDFRRFALSQKKGGTRTRLYLSVLRTWEPLLPPEEAEQQKIADCLSSLDAVIAAEGDRLAALRLHKKGLMQALFPAPTQTTPRLRFPEFEGAGEWATKPLDDLCTILNNRRQPVSSVDRTPGPYPYYGASGIVDRINDYIFDEELLLVGEDGAKWGAFEATAFLADGRYWVNNHAHVLKASGINQKLLEQYLVKIDLANFVSGAAPPKLTLGKLKTIPVPVPPTTREQDKVANCLSSLDADISAQRDKIDTLKTHKSALMQQLFPSPHEASA